MNYTKPVLVINATQRATYECRAENKHVGGKTVESQKATVHILGEYSCSIMKPNLVKLRLFLCYDAEAKPEANQLYAHLWYSHTICPPSIQPPT